MISGGIRWIRNSCKLKRKNALSNAIKLSQNGDQKMERMFVNPVDGEMYPEWWYAQKGISLDQVIEVSDSEDGLIFDIIPENLEKMTFGDTPVLDMIGHFITTLAIKAAESDDPEEAQECASVAGYVSRVMIEKLTGKKMVKH